MHTFSILPGILINMKALVTICARKKREDVGLMPAYDSKVDELGTVMAKQLQIEGITDIVFYTEEKASWVPYTRALVIAAETANVNLTYHQLPPA